MAITQQEQDKEQGDFADAFNEPTAAPVEQSEDQAFGLSPEMPSDAPGEGEPPVTTTEDAAPPAEAEPAQAEPAPVEPAAAELPPEPAATEKEPAAGDVPAGLGIEEGSESPETEAAEKSGNGEGLEAAIKLLSDDFGPEFVEAIKLIATHCAGQKTDEIADKHVGAIGQTLDAIIADMKDGKMQAHFKAIEAKHPDFNVVSTSDEFNGWLKSLPAEEQAQANEVIEGGFAEDVIALLDKFKAAAGNDQDEFDQAADAAEGVRSSGLHIPDSPTANDEYADAWNKA